MGSHEPAPEKEIIYISAYFDNWQILFFRCRLIFFVKNTICAIIGFCWIDEKWLASNATFLHSSVNSGKLCLQKVRAICFGCLFFSKSYIRATWIMRPKNSPLGNSACRRGVGEGLLKKGGEKVWDTKHLLRTKGRPPPPPQKKTACSLQLFSNTTAG